VDNAKNLSRKFYIFHKKQTFDKFFGSVTKDEISCLQKLKYTINKLNCLLTKVSIFCILYNMYDMKNNILQNIWKMKGAFL